MKRVAPARLSSPAYAFSSFPFRSCIQPVAVAFALFECALAAPSEDATDGLEVPASLSEVDTQGAALQSPRWLVFRALPYIIGVTAVLTIATVVVIKRVIPFFDHQRYVRAYGQLGQASDASSAELGFDLNLITRPSASSSGGGSVDNRSGSESSGSSASSEPNSRASSRRSSFADGAPLDQELPTAAALLPTGSSASPPCARTTSSELLWHARTYQHHQSASDSMASTTSSSSSSSSHPSRQQAATDPHPATSFFARWFPRFASLHPKSRSSSSQRPQAPEVPPPSFASVHPEALTAQDVSVALARKRIQLRANVELHRLLWDAGLLSGPPPEDVERLMERARRREERRVRRRIERACGESQLPTYSKQQHEGEVVLVKGSSSQGD